MTNDELVEVTRKYWMTRGTSAGPAHWRAIEREFKRRSDIQAQFDKAHVRNRERAA